MLKPNVALLVSGDNADGIDPPPVAVHPAVASADGTTTTSTARRPRRRQCTVLIEPPLLISEPPLTRKRMLPRPPAQQTQRMPSLAEGGGRGTPDCSSTRAHPPGGWVS